MSLIALARTAVDWGIFDSTKEAIAYAKGGDSGLRTKSMKVTDLAGCAVTQRKPHIHKRQPRVKHPNQPKPNASNLMKGDNKMGLPTTVQRLIADSKVKAQEESQPKTDNDEQTCKGVRTNEEPCQNSFGLNDAGYCRWHTDQAREPETLASVSQPTNGGTNMDFDAIAELLNRGVDPATAAEFARNMGMGASTPAPTQASQPPADNEAPILESATALPVKTLNLVGTTEGGNFKYTGDFGDGVHVLYAQRDLGERVKVQVHANEVDGAIPIVFESETAKYNKLTTSGWVDGLAVYGTGCYVPKDQADDTMWVTVEV